MAKKQFKAESKRLLDLMVNSIYTHKEIFLRELISNASDAEDKLAYRALTDDSVEVKRKDLKITIVPAKEKRTLTVSDNGVGMTKDEFLATDYNSLLRAEFPEEYSSEPAGTIIRQTPKAGRTVKEKQRIVLTVSLGTQYVTIPETKNMVAEDAAQTLKDMGLRVTKKPMVDNSVANGAVIYSQPAAGETVEGDTTVILYVSRSEVARDVTVPSLTGKTIEDARNDVKGLTLSIRTIEQASDQPAGTVLSQSPEANTTVRKTSVITLVVSTGVPEAVQEPEQTGPTVNPDGTISVQESTWWSADGSHQIHQLTDGSMWNENGQRCDSQGNPIG